MHPSLHALRSMSAAELRTYRRELTTLEAERGPEGYRERIELIDRILADQSKYVDGQGVLRYVADDAPVFP